MPPSAFWIFFSSPFAKELSKPKSKSLKLKLEQDTTSEVAVFKKELDLFPDVLSCIVDCKNNIEKMAFSFRVFEETLYRLSIVKKENDLRLWNTNREKEENGKTKKKQDEVYKAEKKLKKLYDDHQKKMDKESE